MIEVLGVKYYDRWDVGQMLNMSAYSAYIRATKCGIPARKYGARSYWTMEEIKIMAELKHPYKAREKKQKEE